MAKRRARELRAWCTTPSLDPPRGRPALQTPERPGKLRRPASCRRRRGTLFPIPPRTARRRPAGPPSRCPWRSRARDPRVPCAALQPRDAARPRAAWSLRPYDVISPARRAELAARDPHNVVAIDLPVDAGAADPDEKYRQAARVFAEWRSDGTLRKDRQPSLYVYEQEYAVPGTSLRRVQRGFFGRLRLEAFGPDAGVLPHERTMAGPKEDRYKLMRATGANFSAVMVLYADVSGAAPRLLAEATEAPAVADVTDDDGVRHRLWMVPDDGPTAPLVAGLREAAGRAPVTIADGHHRYETALRYRDERRITRAGEENPPFDYVLALFMDTTAEPLLALPTHRVARAVSAANGLVEAAASSGLFDVEPADRAALLAVFGPGAQASGGAGRIGLWTRAGGAVLTARREAFAPLLPAGGEAAAPPGRHAPRGRSRAAVRDRPGRDDDRRPDRLHEGRRRGDRVGRRASRRGRRRLPAARPRRSPTSPRSPATAT